MFKSLKIFKVFTTVVNGPVVFFWVFAQCCRWAFRCFGVMYHLHLQGGWYPSTWNRISHPEEELSAFLRNVDTRVYCTAQEPNQEREHRMLFMVCLTKVLVCQTISYAYSMESKSEWISGSMWDEAAMKEFDVGGEPLKWRRYVLSECGEPIATWWASYRRRMESWNPAL